MSPKFQRYLSLTTTTRQNVRLRHFWRSTLEGYTRNSNTGRGLTLGRAVRRELLRTTIPRMLDWRNRLK
jgi:hypothetical protein